jgi:HSP20 family protein
MALVKWSPTLPSPVGRPWAEFDTLRREIDRLFDTHFVEVFSNEETSRALWMPRLDVRELDHVFMVEVDLPGMSIDDIAVSIENNMLVITGDRQAACSGEPGQLSHHERPLGKFERAFTLPTVVEVDKVEARYTNGVLTVTVPKAVAATTKRIAIQAS